MTGVEALCRTCLIGATCKYELKYMAIHWYFSCISLAPKTLTYLFASRIPVGIEVEVLKAIRLSILHFDFFTFHVHTGHLGISLVEFDDEFSFSLP
jgi:hypothetical protein